MARVPPRQIIQQNYAARYHAESLRPHPASGFSGAQLWRLKCPAGEYCLRRWPREHPTPERLRYIHQVLYHASAVGFERLALPVLARTGASFVEHAGHLLELSRWLPGQSRSSETIQPEELRAALAALAEFHAAVCSQASVITPGAACPAVGRRLESMRRFDSWAERLAAEQGSWPTTPLEGTVIRAILTAYLSRRDQLRRELQAAARYDLTLRPCLRDIWSEHVLFTDGHVSGIIDYGAISADSVATDVARLLGSYAGNQGSRWRAGLEGYQGQLPLSGEQIRLVAVLDLSGTILSGMNWLDWLLVQRRTFDVPAAVVARVRWIVGRLADLPARAEEHWLWREKGGDR